MKLSRKCGSLRRRLHARVLVRARHVAEAALDARGGDGRGEPEQYQLGQLLPERAHADPIPGGLGLVGIRSVARVALDVDEFLKLAPLR